MTRLIGILVILLTLVGCKDQPNWAEGATLEATEVKGTSVELAWGDPTPADEISAFRVRKADEVIASLEPDVRAFSADSLEGKTDYEFSVEASNADGEWSSPLKVEVTTLDATAPSWPEDAELRVEVESRGALGARVTFEWTEAEDDTGVTHYRLKREGEEVATWESDQSEFVHSSVDVDGVYRLYAGDAAGNWSEDGPSARVWANKGMKNLLKGGSLNSGPSLNSGF